MNVVREQEPVGIEEPMLLYAARSHGELVTSRVSRGNCREGRVRT